MESCVKRGILTKNSHTHQPLYGGSAERNKRIEKVRWCENERARALYFVRKAPLFFWNTPRTESSVPFQLLDSQLTEVSKSEVQFRFRLPPSLPAQIPAPLSGVPHRGRRWRDEARLRSGVQASLNLHRASRRRSRPRRQ